MIIGVNGSLGAHSPIRIGEYVHISRDVHLETAGLDFQNTKPPYSHISKPITIDRAFGLVVVQQSWVAYMSVNML